MAQTSWPFENIDTTEVQFSQWARHINEGIRPDFANELEVFADDSGLNVTVRSGQAMVRGHYYASTAEETLTITTPDATNPRIDSVVLELDIVANSILLKVVAGTPNASPVAPTLTQSEDGNVYQFLLANVDVAAGVFSIEAGDVTDLRTYMFQGVGKWNTATRPANPIDYQTIGYNTDLNTHEVWNGSAWNSVFAPITTEGDLAIGDNTGTAVRLPIGAADTVLTSNGTTASWQEASGGSGELYAGGNHTISKPAGFYLVDIIQGATVNNSITLVNGLQELPAITSLEVEAMGGSFEELSTPTTDTLNAVVYADGKAVVVGQPSGSVLFSNNDGDSWSFRSIPYSDTSNSIAYGNGNFVVVGGSGNIAYSANGESWTAASNGFGSNSIFDVAFIDNKFIATGNNETLETSPDGITWTTRTTGLSRPINAVAFGNSTYVSVGTLGEIATSPDAVTWTQQVPDTGNSLFGATFGNGLFVAVGNGGTIVTSPDGITWTTRTGAHGSTKIRDVAFIEGVFVAVGDSNTIQTSFDGITWTSTTSPFAGTPIFLGVAGSNGLGFICGQSGFIGRSSTGFALITQLPAPIQA